MGTAITPQLVDVVDTVTAVRSYSSGTARQLRICQEERWGLRTECPTPEDPFYDSEVTWLLPDMNLRLTHRRTRSRHARGGPSELTAVRVFHDGRYWRTTDLLLGLAAPGGTSARIVRSEEFAAVDGIAAAGHDVDAWLAGQGFPVTWPSP